MRHIVIKFYFVASSVETLGIHTEVSHMSLPPLEGEPLKLCKEKAIYLSIRASNEVEMYDEVPLFLDKKQFCRTHF